MTGATLVDNEHELLLEDVKLEHFGKASLIKVTEMDTSIVHGNGDQQKFMDRCDQIRKTIDGEPKLHLKNVHKERLARLQSKIAEIQVGGYSEVERGEERDLIVDALNSAKSAIQGGVLPGGGIAMYNASKLLEDGLPDQLIDESERIGAKLLGQAMKRPVNQLIMNKTGQNGGLILKKIQEEASMFTGFDVRNLKICDMMDAGIYDSYNVIKVILEDAVSLAGMIITTECILVKEKSYKPLPLQHYQERREIF